MRRSNAHHIRRRRKARLEAQKAQAGALGFWPCRRRKRLPGLRAKANEKGLCVREILPDVALIETPRGLLGFGLIALAKGSAAGTEALCALHRAAKAGDARPFAPFRSSSVPGAVLFAQTLADPPRVFARPARYAAIYASFAPIPCRAKRAPLCHRAPPWQKAVSNRRADDFGCAAAAPLFSAGLLLALFGLYLTIRDRKTGLHGRFNRMKPPARAPFLLRAA
jgi:hypothetical protein